MSDNIVFKNTIFPMTNQGKFVLRTAGSIVCEILLPRKGITFAPPESVFKDGNYFARIRLQFDYLSAETLRSLREIVVFACSSWRTV